MLGFFNARWPGIVAPYGLTLGEGPPAFLAYIALTMLWWVWLVHWLLANRGILAARTPYH